MINIDRFHDELTKKRKNYHSILISYNQKLVYKYNDKNAYCLERHNLFSITKTITALLLFDVFRHKKITLDQQIGDVDIPCLNSLPIDLRNQPIKSLFDMTTGITWDEFDDFGSIENDFAKFVRSKNKRERFQNYEINKDEIGKLNYNSSISHLLAYMIYDFTGKSLRCYAEETLFKALGINRVLWNKDTEGLEYGGQGLYLTPFDMLKIGEYIITLTSRPAYETYFDLTHIKDKQKLYNKYYYKNHYWSSQIEGRWYIGAYGHGGQRIIMFPKESLVVVMTGKINPEFGIQEKHISNLFK